MTHGWPYRRELLRKLTDMSDPVRDQREEGIPENPGFFWKLIHLNPALWRGVVIAVFALLSAFGFFVVQERQEAVLGLLMALVALFQAFWTKDATMAKRQVVVYKPDPVAEPTKVSPGPAVSSNVPAVMNAAADDGRKPADKLPFPEYYTGEW